MTLLSGAGGVGKTRLALRAAQNVGEEWATGWLQRDCGDEVVAAITACGQPALVLVDDADTRPDLPALLTSLVAQNLRDPDTKIRALVIARSGEGLRFRYGWKSDIEM